MEGALTIVIAFAGYALLPNYPNNTAFLSAEETAMAQWRLNRENDGVVDEIKESVFVGLKQAFSDPKVVSRAGVSPRDERRSLTIVNLAIACVYSDLCRCLDELHLLLPFHRQDTWLSSGRDSFAHRASIFLGLLVLTLELMAFWTLRRTLFPHRLRMRHLRCRPDCVDDDASDWTSLFRHVLAGDGIFLCIPANFAMGIIDNCATEV
jgi:hypothetical protein